jgi:hypothetical protein
MGVAKLRKIFPELTLQKRHVGAPTVWGIGAGHRVEKKRGEKWGKIKEIFHEIQDGEIPHPGGQLVGGSRASSAV